MRPGSWVTAACTAALAAAVAGCGGGSPGTTVTRTTGVQSAQTSTVTVTRSSQSTATTTAASTQECGTAANGFVTRILARGVDCTTARDVAGAWVQAIQGGRQNPAQVVRVRVGTPFACAARFRGQLAAVICDRNDDQRQGRVVFLAHP